MKKQYIFLTAEILESILHKCNLSEAEDDEKFANMTYHRDYDSNEFKVIWTVDKKDYWVWFDSENSVAISKVEEGKDED